MSKQIVCIEGSLVFPLKVGKRAVIRRGGDFIRTSLVVEIREERIDYVCFETMYAVYRVSLVPVAMEAVLLSSFVRAA